LWRVEIDPKAAREIRKLTDRDRNRIMRFMRERLASDKDPRRTGHALTGIYAGLWTYRVGDLRLIASIEDRVVTIRVLRAGNRRDIYR
jgi:mRNA interferase RelE/StbE